MNSLENWVTLFSQSCAHTVREHKESFTNDFDVFCKRRKENGFYIDELNFPSLGKT